VKYKLEVQTGDIQELGQALVDRQEMLEGSIEAAFICERIETSMATIDHASLTDRSQLMAKKHTPLADLKRFLKDILYVLTDLGR
jgi:hypothetical protein